MEDRFYITTPIYYPNGEPHVGHTYTTVCADVIARYHRLAGDKTFFLTGTDEHGIKMVKTAEAEKTTPGELADRNVAAFEAWWKEIGITNDDFIRTTSERHKLAVQEIVRRLKKNGDIYLGAYEGWYDEGQEEFITETEAKAAGHKSVISGRPLVRYKEPTYFFKLTKYVDQVYRAIESDQLAVRPESRKNEVLSKLKNWDADLSISRSSLKWGIPIPDDPDHVLYVWIDALSNYITALGYPLDENSERFKTFWPADVHLIGKEILWFHAFYWPAILIALDLPLPKVLYAHGWWTAEGKKMSKSLGNFLDLDKIRQYIAKYGNDALRFYLLRAAPFGNDLDWTEVDFVKSFTELGNVVGNCLNRVLKMVNKYRDGKLPAWNPTEQIDHDLIARADGFAGQLDEAYGKLDLQQCTLIPVELARAANGYIDTTAPFSLAKDPAKASRLDTVLGLSALAIQRALVGLLPVLPDKAAQGLRQLGIEPAGKTIAELLTPLSPGHKVGEGLPLFPRVDSGKPS